MNLVLFGPPGSGKGTHADALSQRFQVVHVSTGDMLREAVKNQTELGRQAGSLMAEGKLVPDVLVGGIVREKIQSLAAAGKGILFDGYPRNLEQAAFLDQCLAETGGQIDAVVVLEVADEMLVKRICGRRLCKECGASFNIYSIPPKEAGKCDACGGELIQRKDDNEETLRERLAVYREQTLPILDHYAKKNLLIKIDASGNIADIRDSILREVARKCEKAA
jgi:adenylate kinase